MTAAEWARYIGLGALCGLMILEIFYKSHVMGAVGAAAGGVLFPMLMRPSAREKKKQRITDEFRKALYLLSAALRAGRSLESAFEAAVEDMDPQEYPMLWEYWNHMLSRLKLNQRLEDLFFEFADDTGIEDIVSFAQITAVSKRTEGDISRIIENTVRLLRDKIEMQQELTVILAQKQAEQRVMNVMPFVVIGMLTSLSPDYVAPLYTTVVGRIVMTAALILAGAGLALSAHLSHISM